MTKPKLLPCPWCGYDDRLIVCETDFEPEKRKAYAVSCRTKNCHGCIFILGFGQFKTEKLAIKAWNRGETP